MSQMISALEIQAIVQLRVDEIASSTWGFLSYCVLLGQVRLRRR
jgi:hypothetical protein